MFCRNVSFRKGYLISWRFLVKILPEKLAFLIKNTVESSFQPIKKKLLEIQCVQDKEGQYGDLEKG